MIAVRMVEMSIDEVVDVVAMGNRLMAAVWSVPMPLIVSAAVMTGSAGCRIR
jgi:hypothetical protein